MARASRGAAAAGLLGLALLASPRCAAPASEAAPPVVVELFTSQGCSSCPDADALLSRWGAAEFAKGRVLPLSFDVDYWNYLGWRDVFSAPAHSRRQKDYARALGVGVYTPQFVVGGRASVAGADGARVEEAVRRLAGAPRPALIRVTSSPSPRVKLEVEIRQAGRPKGEPRAMLALFENGLVTAVGAGENGGRTLRNDFVVRRLVDLGPLPADGKTLRRYVDDPWDPSWSKVKSGAAVFIQDGATLAITDAGWVYPLER